MMIKDAPSLRDGAEQIARIGYGAIGVGVDAGTAVGHPGWIDFPDYQDRAVALRAVLRATGLRLAGLQLGVMLHDPAAAPRDIDRSIAVARYLTAFEAEERVLIVS